MPDGQIVAFPDNMPREQINSMIYSRYPDLSPKTENVPNAVKWAVNRMQKEGRTEPSLWENIVVGLSGSGEGAGGALSKGASGFTLGGSDYAQRKMGINPNETVEKIIDSTNSPTVAALTGLASGGAEVAGGLPLGAGTFKLAAGLPKYGRLAAGVGTSAGMGGISSAFNSDFDPRETAKGSITGATIDLGLRGAGKGLAKVFSAAERVKGVPRGLANAAADDKGASILDRAVKESKKTAKQVYAQAPEALDTINRRATEQIDDAVRGVDIQRRMAGAKKAYGDFIDENKANQIIKGADDLSALKGTFVVDEAGNPLKVYHGSNASFNKFDKSKIGANTQSPAGFNFSADKDVAKSYGDKVYETYLNMKSPITIDFDGKSSVIVPAFNETRPLNPMNVSAYVKDINKSLKNNYDLGDETYDLLRNIGFDSRVDNQIDGVILKNISDSYGIGGKTATNYMVFEPEQIVMANSIKKANPKVSDLGISDKLSNTQNKALNTAWKQGADSLKKGEAIGSLKHIDEMKKSLNKMIEQSKVANPNGVGTVDTSDTVALRELKGYLQETMDNAGLSGISKQYREAKRLEEAFNAGKKYNPNAQKVSDFNLKTADERNAFAQGLAEKAKLNPESKNIAGKIADVRGALRETIGEKANPLFNSVDDLDRTYQNVSNLRNLAGRKLVKADPIGKLTAGPIREWGDSKLSPVFALADVARRWGTGNVAERAAKYLLNPNLKVGRSWNDAIQPAIPSISTYLSNKRNKKGDK